MYVQTYKTKKLLLQRANKRDKQRSREKNTNLYPDIYIAQLNYFHILEYQLGLQSYKINGKRGIFYYLADSPSTPPPPTPPIQEPPLF